MATWRSTRQFNLGGYFTNNGLIFGDGNIESTATPPPTLTDAEGPPDGGGTMGIDVPVDYQGIVLIPDASTMTLSYPTTGGTWTGDGELLLFETSLTDPTFAGLADLYSLYGSVSPTSPVSLPTLTESVGGSFGGTTPITVPAGNTLALESGCSNSSTTGTMVNDGTISLESGCNGLNLGGPLTNNGTINGGGAIESPLSPPPTLTNASGGTITPSQFPGAEQGGEYLTVKIPLDNEGIETIPSGATLELDASATGGTWTGDGELLLFETSLTDPTFAGLANLYSLYGSVSSTSPVRSRR